jgi:anti-sigma factor RsiW
VSDPQVDNPTPACDAERVTAYVDGQLAGDARAALEAHLAACPACREQEAFERGLRARLRALPAVEVPFGLETRVRRRVRSTRTRHPRRWLAAAAMLVVGLLWIRSAPVFVAWELARDHAHCFGKKSLPAKVWTDEPDRAAAWFRGEGVTIPYVPASAGGLVLVGARRCPLLDRRVAHLYYSAEDGHASLFVVPGTVRFEGDYRVSPGGRHVQLFRAGGATLAVVSDDSKVVSAFRRSFLTTLAAAPQPGPEAEPQG